MNLYWFNGETIQAMMLWLQNISRDIINIKIVLSFHNMCRIPIKNKDVSPVIDVKILRNKKATKWSKMRVNYVRDKNSYHSLKNKRFYQIKWEIMHRHLQIFFFFLITLFSLNTRCKYHSRVRVAAWGCCKGI